MVEKRINADCRYRNAMDFPGETVIHASTLSRFLSAFLSFPLTVPIPRFISDISVALVVSPSRSSKIDSPQGVARQA